MEDREIIRMFFDRDEKALEATGQKYEHSLLQIAKNILRDSQEAEECYNDMLFGVWKNIPPAKPDHLFAYLAKSIRYIACDRLDYKTAKKRSANVLELTEEIERYILPRVDDEIRLEGEEIGRLVSQFLRTMKYEQRAVFVRRYWYGDSLAEIAKMLHISEGKTKSILFRTRKQLKSYLEQEEVYL